MMQSFSNSNDDELERLVDKIYHTVKGYLLLTGKNILLYSSDEAETKDIIKNLVLIATTQNPLFLRFPAILAFYVSKFLQEIMLSNKNLEEINNALNKLVNEVKKFKNLPLSAIKQMLQQKLEETQQKKQKQQTNLENAQEEQNNKENIESEGEKGEQQNKESGESEEQETGEEEAESAGQYEKEAEGEEESESIQQEGSENEEGEEETEGSEGEEGEERQGENEEGEQTSQTEGEISESERTNAEEQEEGGNNSEEETESEQSEEGEQNEQGAEEQETGEEEGSGEQEAEENEEESNAENTQQGGSEEKTEQTSNTEEQESESEQLGENEKTEQGEEESGESENEGEISESTQEQELQEEIDVLNDLQEALDQASLVLSVGRGGDDFAFEQTNPRVLELIDRADKIIALANELDLSYNNRGVKEFGGVMKGVTTGNNLKHLFRSQHLLPDEIFFERYTNRTLLQKSLESEGQGDLYFIIDKSGSMNAIMRNGYTALENVSAVALASALEAEKFNRHVYVQYFSDRSTLPYDVTNDVLKLAEVQPGGGTDIMTALSAFEEYYQEYPDLQNVKQLFILSDFDTPYNIDGIEEFKDFAKTHGITITCLHVYPGNYINKFMQTLIDALCDEYYRFNNYDAGQLFSVIYSKIS